MEENSQESNEKHTYTKEQTGPRRLFPRWQCPMCGTRTWITNKNRHLRTKKHNDVVYISTERFEMR